MSTPSRGPFRRSGTDCLAVILAGGLGTRMGSLSLDRPKHLLEIGGEPVIAHQLRWLAGHGVVDVVLATAHLADRFAPVLGDGSRWGVRLQYATEPAPLGTGGGLRFAVAARGDVPDWIVVVNGDLLTGHDLGRQLALADDRLDAVLHIRTVDDARPFGCVVADAGGRVTAFLEKSPHPPSHEVNGGTYVLAARVVEAIGPGVVSLERDVLPALVARGGVTAYREQALWEDIGTPEAVVRTSRRLVLASGADAHIDPTATIAADAVVADGSAIGPHAVVGPGARVIGSVVMAEAVVGAGAVVSGAAVPPAAIVPDGAVIEGGPWR